MTKDEIIEHYLRFDEDNRLKNAYGVLEQAHTRQLILRNIPSPMAVIYDIAAGTGPYSSWLAGLGYPVHYSDIVPQHVDLFRNRHQHTDNIVSIGVEDARNLSYADRSADLIILNGPLYHLPEKEERLQVLREAKRVLKDNGRLLGFTLQNHTFSRAYFHFVEEIEAEFKEVGLQVAGSYGCFRWPR